MNTHVIITNISFLAVCSLGKEIRELDWKSALSSTVYKTVVMKISETSVATRFLLGKKSDVYFEIVQKRQRNSGTTVRNTH